MNSKVIADKLQVEVVEILREFELVRRRGDVKEIAKKCAISEVHASCVLRGHFYNEAVIDEAYDRTIERKSKWLSRSLRLKELQ